MTAAKDATVEVEAFAQRCFADIGGTLVTALAHLGDRLGLYRAMADGGALAPEALAERTGTDARYVREWLSTMAAAGYVAYDAEHETFRLPPAQREVLTDETSPFCVLGGFQSYTTVVQMVDRLERAFRDGCGVGWHEHGPGLFEGTERLFRPGYQAYLVREWIPALQGVEARLHEGAQVADIGCGHGASTLILAAAYPRSRFVGYDYHAGSVEAARARAERAGLADRVRFEVASAKDYPGRDYDLVCSFDCLHDMGDPAGAARHVRETLRPDGTWLVVEPFANDRLEDNLNPLGVVFYGASTMICTPASKAQEVGLALGAQAGEARLRQVIEEGGFTRFRRATETAFNLVLEARP